MKRMVVVLVAWLMLLGGNGTAAEDTVKKEVAKPAFELSAEVEILSAYVGGMVGTEFYNGTVIQPSFTITHRSGLYFMPWMSYAWGKSFLGEDEEGDNAGNEIDLIAGWSGDVGPMKADFYYAFYNVFPIDKWGTDDVHALGVKLDWPINDMLTPYICGEYYHTVNASDQDGGAYRFGVKVSAHKHAEVDISLAGHSSVFGSASEPLSSGKVSLSFPFEWKGIGISPEANFQKRFGRNEEDGGLTKDKFWYGLKLAYTF